VCLRDADLCSVLLDRLRSMHAASERAVLPVHSAVAQLPPLVSEPLRRIEALGGDASSTTAAATTSLASLSDPLAALGGTAQAADAIVAFLLSGPRQQARTQAIVDHFKFEVRV
jgi:hypothetical protein